MVDMAGNRGLVNKVFDRLGLREEESGDEVHEGEVEVDFAHLDEPRRMALTALGRAFNAAEAGEDWFAMRRELRRVDDAVNAVWYAARVRRGENG